MSIISAGGKILGAGALIFSDSAVGAPAAPTNVVATLDPTASNGIDVLFFGPDARSISPITQYTGQLLVSGVPTGSPVSVLRNSATGAVSSYIHFNNVAAGTYTVAVTATNANGTSSAGVSNSITTSAPSDYYISQGNSASTTSPQNTAWSAFTGSGNNYADTAQTYNGQTNSISINPGGLALPFYKNIFSNFVANGNFYTDPFAHITLLVFGTNLTGGNVDMSFRYAGFCFGTVSTGGSNTFTDNSQNFVTNGWSGLATASNGSFQNKGGTYAGNLTTSTNTANAVTVTGSGGHNWSGDTMWLASIGDTDFPNGATSPAPISTGIRTYTVAQFNSSGTQTGSTTNFVNGSWNLVQIPMSVMNNQTAPTNNVSEFWYPHAIQEFRIANSSSNATIYITNFGVTVS